MVKVDKDKTDKPTAEHWKLEPDAHDYPAAADYLSLVLSDSEVKHAVSDLQSATLIRRKAKDLLRASRLPLLGKGNPGVKAELSKVDHGDRLSPVLLVRGSLPGDVALTVADGYHRICASYHLDEDADVPCRLIDTVS